MAVSLALRKDIGAVPRTAEVTHESRGLHCSEQRRWPGKVHESLKWS